MAIGELLRVYVHHNYAGQNAIDVRKTEELYMLSSDLPIAVFVFKPSATPTMRIEKISAILKEFCAIGAMRGVRAIKL